MPIYEKQFQLFYHFMPLEEMLLLSFSVCYEMMCYDIKIQTQMCHRSDWLNLPKGKIIMKIPREVNTSNVIISQPVGQHF